MDNSVWSSALVIYTRMAWLHPHMNITISACVPVSICKFFLIWVLIIVFWMIAIESKYVVFLFLFLFLFFPLCSAMFGGSFTWMLLTWYISLQCSSIGDFLLFPFYFCGFHPFWWLCMCQVTCIVFASKEDRSTNFKSRVLDFKFWKFCLSYNLSPYIYTHGKKDCDKNSLQFMNCFCFINFFVVVVSNLILLVQVVFAEQNALIVMFNVTFHQITIRKKGI